MPVKTFINKLNGALSIITENTQTDFYDVYLLASFHRLDGDARQLFIDRVDRLYDTIVVHIHNCMTNNLFDPAQQPNNPDYK